MSEQLIVIALVGAGVGFLGGLLGKGGSAIATPVLVVLGVPAVVALTAPLPATVPSTFVAAQRYRKEGLIDRRVMLWSLVAGLPAAVLGTLSTRWVDPGNLIRVTEVILVMLGLKVLLSKPARKLDDRNAPPERGVLIGVGLASGFAAGLLANSGGFLLAPLFVGVLGLAIKPALGTSLAVATFMAIPVSLLHLAMGHIDPLVVVVFAIGSVPFSRLGATCAISSGTRRLEYGYGIMLVLFGISALLAPLL